MGSVLLGGPGSGSLSAQFRKGVAMSSFTISPHRRYEWVLVLVLAIGVLASGGCSDDDDENPINPGGPTTTTFTGIMANGTENGAISITINSTSLVAPFSTRLAASPRGVLAPSLDIVASGVFRPIGAASVALTGTYNDQGDTLNLSGGGYTLSGAYDTTGTYPGMLGQYDGPNGAGFFGSVTGVAGALTLCGTFQNDSTLTTGNWDILIAGSEVAGVAFPEGAEPFGFEGTIETTGTMRAITAGDSDPGNYTLTVTGTLDTTTNTATGSWTYEDFITPSTAIGTWSGSPCPQ
jgi:hypothetical protein